MLKSVYSFVLFIVVQQIIFADGFFVAENEELMLVPSVAFRYHSSELALLANAKSTDDWILHTKGQ